MGFIKYLTNKILRPSNAIETKKPLVLIDNADKVINYVLENGSFESKILIYAFENLNFQELQEAFLTIKMRDKDKYTRLLKVSENLACFDDGQQHYYYAFQTKIQKDFSNRHLEAEKSLNTGDFHAFLLGQYLSYKDETDEIIKPALNSVLTSIICAIMRNHIHLKAEMEQYHLETPLNLSKAISLFLLYDKEIALNKFKHIVKARHKDERASYPDVVYWQAVHDFFRRIGIDYIPKIDISSIKLAEGKESITKEELLKMTDKHDCFNKRTPLENFKEKELIHPKNNIKNIEELKNIISSLFNDYHKEIFNCDPSLDLGLIFVENITEPFPQFSQDKLIEARETIKEMLEKSIDFKYTFLIIIKLEHDSENITSWISKFPKLFNQYLDGLEGFSESSIKHSFNANTSEKFRRYQKIANKYIGRNNINS